MSSPLFPRLPHRVRKPAEAALRDAQLQQFVDSTTRKKNEARKQVLTETFGDRVAELRARAGELRQHTLDHLDHYLERFIDAAEASGAVVHFARDAGEARAIGTAIARECGAKLCVKSKSMVTEEIELLPALEAIGCETIETDLGEFILQIRGDAPSHIVTPMIHLDRAAVARAFVETLGAAYTEDAAELTRIAREHLRAKYREADLGISGANFLVAESGSVVLCTNEGNGRFCTTAPDTHLVFAGIEKLVPRLRDLPLLLKLLARSSTGQPLTCYTQVLTGPRADGESDGPRRMHVILVDHGRTDALRPESREMLRCIRCGACLNTCPVYRRCGGHAYGSVYSGPIGAVLTPVLRGAGNYPDLSYASSLCSACNEACPVSIDLHGLLVRGRRELVREGETGFFERWMTRLWTGVLLSPRRYRFALKAMRRLLRRRARDGWIERLRGPGSGWTAERDLKEPPERGFREWWENRE